MLLSKYVCEHTYVCICATEEHLQEASNSDPKDKAYSGRLEVCGILFGFFSFQTASQDDKSFFLFSHLSRTFITLYMCVYIDIYISMFTLLSLSSFFINLLDGVLDACDGEESCQVCRVGGDDNQSKKPPSPHHQPGRQGCVWNLSSCGEEGKARICIWQKETLHALLRRMKLQGQQVTTASCFSKPSKTLETRFLCNKNTEGSPHCQPLLLYLISFTIVPLIAIRRPVLSSNGNRLRSQNEKSKSKFLQCPFLRDLLYKP